MGSKLEILCGMIASGKSTYCKKRAAEGAVIVDMDAIVLACHGGLYGLYSDKYKPIYKTVETSFITSAFCAGKDVVIDRTCLNTRTRARYISLAESFDIYEIECVKFDKESPEIHAKRRFESDNRGISYDVWLKVAERHAKNYQAPKMCEGFSKIIHISKN